MSERPSLVLRLPSPLEERHAAALRRAFDEDLIRVPLLSCEATVAECGASFEISIEFDQPRGFTIVVDPEN